MWCTISYYLISRGLSFPSSNYCHFLAKYSTICTSPEVSWFFLSSSSVRFQKQVDRVQTNMVAWVVRATNIKSDFRFDLQGCLEAVLASKPHFLCCSQIDLLTRNQFFQNFQKNLQKSSKKSPKIKFSVFLHVSRISIRSEPCYTYTMLQRFPLYMRIRYSSVRYSSVGYRQSVIAESLHPSHLDLLALPQVKDMTAFLLCTVIAAPQNLERNVRLKYSEPSLTDKILTGS